MKVIKSITVNPDIWAEITELAKNNNRSVSNQIELIIRKYLNNI